MPECGHASLFNLEANGVRMRVLRKTQPRARVALLLLLSLLVLTASLPATCLAMASANDQATRSAPPVRQGYFEVPARPSMPMGHEPGRLPVRNRSDAKLCPHSASIVQVLVPERPGEALVAIGTVPSTTAPRPAEAAVPVEPHDLPPPNVLGVTSSLLI